MYLSGSVEVDWHVLAYIQCANLQAKGMKLASTLDWRFFGGGLPIDFQLATLIFLWDPHNPHGRVN